VREDVAAFTHRSSRQRIDVRRREPTTSGTWVLVHSFALTCMHADARHIQPCSALPLQPSTNAHLLRSERRCSTTASSCFFAARSRCAFRKIARKLKQLYMPSRRRATSAELLLALPLVEGSVSDAKLAVSPAWLGAAADGRAPPGAPTGT
jgi:hypothetical protein